MEHEIPQVVRQEPPGIALHELRAFPESAFLDEPGMMAQMRDEIIVKVEELALIHGLDQVAVRVILLFSQMGQHPSCDIRPSGDGAEVVDLGQLLHVVEHLEQA